MKVNRYLFKNKDYVLEGDIDYSNVSFDPSHIRSIGLTHIKITGNDYDELFVVNVVGTAEVVGVCAYSLEDVLLKIKINDTLTFTFEEEDEDVIHIDNPIFEIDPYILDLIISEIPLKIVKPGAKLPEAGDGYRVMSEDEYLKENSEKKDHRWDKLDDIKID